jgi:hypothetical protein
MQKYDFIDAFFDSHYPKHFDVGSPAIKLYKEGNTKEKALVYMLDRQIAYKNNEFEELKRTNNSNTKSLANEIIKSNGQLKDLKSSIKNLSNDLDANLNEIKSELETSNYLLNEVIWELSQVNNTLNDIFYVLKNSRRILAQEYVEQGSRLMLDNSFSLAKERFELAFKEDPTDFQVLMNLGYLAIIEEDINSALDHFLHASKWPKDINSSKLQNAKAKALRNVARVYYAKKEFQNAYTSAKEVLKITKERNTNDIYVAALYAGLSGDISFCLNGIKNAISVSPKYFTESVANPDLYHIREDVYGLLRKLSQEKHRLVQLKINTIDKSINRINFANRSFVNLKNKIFDIIKIGEKVLISNDFTKKYKFNKLNEKALIEKFRKIGLALDNIDSQKNDYDENLIIKSRLKQGTVNNEGNKVDIKYNVDIGPNISVGIGILIWLASIILAYIHLGTFDGVFSGFFFGLGGAIISLFVIELFLSANKQINIQSNKNLDKQITKNNKDLESIENNISFYEKIKDETIRECDKLYWHLDKFSKSL